MPVQFGVFALLTVWVASSASLKEVVVGATPRVFALTVLALLCVRFHELSLVNGPSRVPPSKIAGRFEFIDRAKRNCERRIKLAPP